MELIKSPLNYTGNKFRILEQLLKYFPNNIDFMIDLFCGGATVGLNTPCNKVAFVDKDPRIINLLSFLSKKDFKILLSDLEKLTQKFYLSNSFRNGYALYRSYSKNKSDNNGLKEFNKRGYYILRETYNLLLDKSTDQANTMLYLLMLYSFNNDIRFNAKGEFNLPVGKTDLNKINVDKLKLFMEKTKNLDSDFLCADYNSSVVMELINKSDFVYMDPPYLVGDAVYNASWNKIEELRLLKFIDLFIENKKNFALSNVISKVNMINVPLQDWCEKNHNDLSIYTINYNYKSASYHKIIRDAQEKEVLITNRR